ncbi:MAG: nucleotide exchange factor GrpE [Acaryochloris sp. RU_4_1]|nr:nucleotide exchange factor GrpE [Acaryochloris sp. SU_5_25]NJM66423.1 nucleotide exchange factor GrpE [Acaryochloris sp. RU_4_1]NJR54200.1 nucleotide exchange factor GrpE [Acaryochloris sp. CRU_2_0]
MSEDTKQQETEANTVSHLDESSHHLEESDSVGIGAGIDNSEQESREILEDLAATEGTKDSIDASAADPDLSEHCADSSEALAQLTSEVETLRSQLDERTSQYMRIVADFENFRKRTTREKTELEQRVKRDTLSELLPVIDSFDRARSHIKPQTDSEENIHNSYQGVYKQLVDCLKRIGVSPMRSQGQPFDPNLHEAVMKEPTHEFEEGIVIEELVSGYLLGEQVLRHAMVKVAAPLESDPSAAQEAPEQAENAVSE